MELAVIIPSGLYNEQEEWIWFYFFPSEGRRHCFDKSILRAFCMPGGVLGAGHVAVNSANDKSSGHRGHCPVGGERKGNK